jgi:hypothetical protein
VNLLTKNQKYRTKTTGFSKLLSGALNTVSGWIRIETISLTPTQSTHAFANKGEKDGHERRAAGKRRGV